MSFDRGQYSMMGLPSRQVAQRDLHSHSRLKIRRTRADSKEESAEERLKRLKQELEQREKATSAAKAAAVESTAGLPKPEEKVKLQEFDDADSLPSSASSSEDEEEDEPKPKTQANKADKALAKELERIKKEKAMKEQAAPTAKVSLGVNPLLEKTSIQRRWDDDVIFKNQAKSEPERNEKRLVNDIIHSDTHKKFMKKFIH